MGAVAATYLKGLSRNPFKDLYFVGRSPSMCLAGFLWAKLKYSKTKIPARIFIAKKEQKFTNFSLIHPQIFGMPNTQPIGLTIQRE